MSLLTVQNAKTSKGEDLGYLTGILYLAPFTEAFTHGIAKTKVNLCPHASKGCAKACLFTAGRGRFDSVLQGRLRKTKLFLNSRKEFMQQLIKDIQAIKRKAVREGLMPCIRLNGTSDIPWENVKLNGQNIFEIFPDTQFYDYTKSIYRLRKALPENYHVTFSRSESNHKETLEAIKLGVNVAVVFESRPDTFEATPVIDGDAHDLRFLDGYGVIVGLKAKGMAKKDTSGFVVLNNNSL